MFMIMVGMAVTLFNKFAGAEEQQALSDLPIIQSVKDFFERAKSAIEPSNSVPVQLEQPAKPEQAVKTVARKRSGGKPGIVCIEVEGGVPCGN